jgi:Tol biopolymer transport system component/DNA-binding winged helix-turn-helix (wHTH) protein
MEGASRHLVFGDFELDGAKRLLYRQGEPVPLNSKAFDLLLALVERPGEVLTKDELMQSVWPDQFVEEGNLAVQISALRKIFGEKKDEHRFIVTVPGRGYSFVADVDGNGTGDIVIESHRLSHIVVESEVEKASSVETNQTFRKVLVVAAAFAILLTVAFSYWLYQQAYGRQVLAYGWTDSTLDALTPRQLTANGKVHFAALSPDGAYYAYTTQGNKPSLWFAHVGGKQQVEIRPPEAVTYHGLTFSPDGTEIYYVASDPQNPHSALFRIPVFGGAAQKVLVNIESPVTFSPDGKQVAFARVDRERKLSTVYVADSENGANQRELATRAPEQGFSQNGPAWSPDGKVIAIAARSGEAIATEIVVLVSTEDGKVEKFGATDWTEVRRLAWLKDGSGLFLNVIEKKWDDRHLWMMEYPGGKAHKVTRDLYQYGAASLSVSDDGTKLLSVNSMKVSNISVGSADALADLKQITGNAIGKRDGGEGLAWTADGRIVFSASFDKSATIWAMDADGANAKQLTPPGLVVDRYPAASRDNRYLVFHSTRDGKWNLWRVGTDGGDLRQLTTDGESWRQFSSSLDGQWILYSSDAPGGLHSIWKVSIEGGEPVRLTDKTSSYPSVSPDGKMFACSYHRAGGSGTQLAVFPIEGGEPLYLFDVPRGTTFAVGLRWMPDGQGVVYRDSGPGLWQQRLSGGQPERILELPGETIYGFDWSLDGKKFAVAHGEEIRDVVLVTNN